jgi:hypothetical protein
MLVIDFIDNIVRFKRACILKTCVTSTAIIKTWSWSITPVYPMLYNQKMAYPLFPFTTITKIES